MGMNWKDQAQPAAFKQPTTADTAMIGGVKTWAGGAYSGMPVDRTPANAGDLTPFLRNPGMADPTGRVQPAVQPPSWATPGRGPGPVAMPYFPPPMNGGGFARTMPYTPSPGDQQMYAGGNPNFNEHTGQFVGAPVPMPIGGMRPGPGALPQPPFMGVANGDRSSFSPGGLGSIPSLQRWNRLAPSEQAGYTSYLQQQLGVHAPDVMWLMNKLRPQGLGGWQPRWAGGY